MTSARKIFGHYSPDTDATASAIIWSWYSNTVLNKPATPYVLGTPNTEATFVLQYWQQDQPNILTELNQNDEVIIVDTNNPDELPSNLGQANITQIIDHHKLVGGLSTNQPIDITIKPLASTASVMMTLMSDAAKKNMPTPIKGLVLSCILSDTLAFRSPTTTTFDQNLTESLATELKLDIHDYAQQMFAAKSDVSHLSALELIHLDSKVYPVQDKKFRVSVIETTTPKTILSRQQEIQNSIETLVSEGEIDGVLFFIVDILAEQATLLIDNDITKQVAESSFNQTVTEKTLVLPGVVSRKKQIVPTLKY